MNCLDKNSFAERFAEVTKSLLHNCTEKEILLAKKHGLNEAELKCINHFNSNESINNTEIAKRMDLSPSRLTRIIDGLVEKGIMNRELNRQDRRNMVISFTDKGKKLMDDIQKSYVDVHKDILNNIDSNLHETLVIALEKLLVAIEQWLTTDHKE